MPEAAPFKSWAELDGYIARKGLFHMELGLERIKHALKRHKLLPLPSPVVQVLGTNGKGSTSAFLESLGRSHGLKTGLFLSPHFVSIRERILIDGQQIPEDIWLEAANDLTETGSLTYFEYLTLLAAKLFASLKVDLAIFEAGLGGRNDSTSALGATIHCFGPVALDHAAVIGPGLRAIACDKAAAINAGSTVFTGQQFPLAFQILADRSKACQATLESVSPLQTDSSSGLKGHFQKQNAAVALAAWRFLARNLGIASCYEQAGLEQAFIPGRMQSIPAGRDHPALLLDGAHNPHAIKNMLANLQAQPKAVIFSALADKNWQDSLGMILRSRAMLIVPQIHNSRAADANLIARQAKETGAEKVRVTANLEDALKSCLDVDGYVAVCGSLYLLSAFFQKFPQYLQKDT